MNYQYKGTGFSNTVIDKYSDALLLELYGSMLRIRMIEEEIERRYHEDEMKTPIHLVIGQEAGSVGCCTALEKTDDIYCSHRTHGNYLAKGGDLRAMMAELYCRSTGCAGSRGGSMHLIDKSAGVAGTSAIVAGIIPVATGAAFAARTKKPGKIVGVFFGDAALEEGALWESLNFAVLHKLPILYLCENNFYSVCTPLDERQPPSTELFKKAEAFGARSLQVDATNIVSVYEASSGAAEYARNGNGPVFIELIAYRWRGHGGAGDDSHTGYRDPAEVEQWRAVCPIESFRKVLKDKAVLQDDYDDNIRRQFGLEIKDAFEYAINSPNPEQKDLKTFVYSS